MDVCYVLGTGSLYDNLELRLSLRSLEKNAKNLESIFIIGEKPHWIKNVVHIPVKDNLTSEKNVFNKILVACESDISKEFLFMNDDFYMMKPFDIKEYPYFINGELRYIENPSRYQMINNKTMVELQKMGIERVMDFGSHCPIRYKKEKFLSLKKYYDESKEKICGYSHRNLYGNLFVNEYIQAIDCKLWGSDEMRETEQGCISTKDECDDIIDKLFEIFNKPSKYEKSS